MYLHFYSVNFFYSFGKLLCASWNFPTLYLGKEPHNFLLKALLISYSLNSYFVSHYIEKYIFDFLFLSPQLIQWFRRVQQIQHEWRMDLKSDWFQFRASKPIHIIECFQFVYVATEKRMGRFGRCFGTELWFYHVAFTCSFMHFSVTLLSSHISIRFALLEWSSGAVWFYPPYHFSITPHCKKNSFHPSSLYQQYAQSDSVFHF